MIVLTHDQVVDRIVKFCDRYKFFVEAAEAIGCTKAQLSLAVQKKEPPCPAILVAIGITRAPLFVVGNVDKKYLTAPKGKK